MTTAGEFRKIVAEIERSVQQCSVSSLKAALWAMDALLVGRDGFPEELFNPLVDIIGLPSFDGCAAAWLVLNNLNDNAYLLSDDQKLRLTPRIVAKFGTGGEKQAFLIAVLLSEVCMDREAAKALAILISDQKYGAVARAALKTLDNRTTLPSIKEIARAALR